MINFDRRSTMINFRLPFLYN